ncbi:MFS transporter [Candidatus Thorarchaeota archaeon]|nr:MAG: MFS transporter [Candidatus Thorarchaeota archaeon]
MEQTQEKSGSATGEDLDVNGNETPLRSSLVQIILASTLLAPLGVPFLSPALPVLRDVFLVSEAETSLLISAYFVVGIVFSPFIGMVVDRFGRRPVLGGSLLILGLSGGMLFFAPNFWFILGTRVLQGTAAAGLFITTVTLISDNFDGVQRNNILGMNGAVLALGAAALPILGGALVAFSWNTPFLAYFVAVPLGFIALKFIQEPDGAQQGNKTSLRATISALSQRAMIVPYSASVLLEILFFGAILTSLPFFLTNMYGIGPVTIGLVVSVTSISSVPFSIRNGYFARYLSNSRLIALGFLLHGVGLMIAWSASSLILTALGAVIFGTGVGFSVPAIDSRITNCVTKEHRGEALSIRNSATFLGRTTGPLIFAAIAQVTGYPLLLLGAGLFSVVLAAVVVFMPSPKRAESDRQLVPGRVYCPG